MSKDTIYIQDAIDAFNLQSDDDGWWCGTAEDMEKLLKGLPSAEPRDNDYSYMGDPWEYFANTKDGDLSEAEKQIKFIMWVGYAKGKRAISQINEDTISRQAATTIPILPIEHRKYQTMNIDDAYDLGWLDCQNCIEKLPPAQSKDWMEQNKDRILKAGMEGREIEFRIGGRLFAIREKAQ